MRAGIAMTAPSVLHALTCDKNSDAAPALTWLERHAGAMPLQGDE